MALPVERKVQASTGAAAMSGLVLWVIGRYIFRGNGVPDVIASWVYVIVPGIVTFAAGYFAKHTSRPPALPVLVPPLPVPPPVPVPPVPALSAPDPGAAGPLADS